MGLLIRRRSIVAPGPDAVAATVLRLAVLLQAGIAPEPAWRHLARSGDAAASAVRRELDAGDDLVAAIARRGGSWRELAVAWEVATTVGAPLSLALRSAADALTDAHAAADDVRAALAEPSGTARLMLWMPLVGVGLGVALGFDTLTVLFGSAGGFSCLGAGAALFLAARRWTRSLVAKAQPAGGIPGLRAELIALALSGGTSIDRARAVVAAALERQDVEADDDANAAIDVFLDLSRSAGVPAAELLRAAAAHDRQAARTDGRVRAARLSSRLLLPLGVCTLPAFLLLGVAPMLLSVLSTATISL